VTHLPYVAGAYGLGLLIPAGFAIVAWTRMRMAARRLAAIDPRARRRAQRGAGWDA
jgi:type IV secretory pathway TrbD component